MARTMKVRKVTYWCPVPLDDDGTPLHHGERMTEIEPGVWADPVYEAVMSFLDRRGAQHGGKKTQNTSPP